MPRFLGIDLQKVEVYIRNEPNTVYWQNVKRQPAGTSHAFLAFNACTQFGSISDGLHGRKSFVK